MNDYILETIKKMLGIDDADMSFDTDITVHLNSAIMALAQIGLESAEDFIVDSCSKWEDLLDDATNLEAVKSYLYFMVRKMFDPPQSSSAVNALDQMLSQMEWRISVAVDPGKDED